MKTIVYQSYRTENVPTWINTCMQTVKDWATLKDFDYQMIDDKLFDYVPDWYKEKVNGKIQPISDLARLELAKEFLLKGYERTIWMDADILIFHPKQLNVNTIEEYLFCHEAWISLEAGSEVESGKIICRSKVNNAMAIFTQKNSFLDFYIYACKEIVRNSKDTVSLIEIGTKFLTNLHQFLPLHLFKNLGLLSPLNMYGIAENKKYLTQEYTKLMGAPIYAANLCSTFRNTSYQGIDMNDKVYEIVIEKLLETKGELVNQYFQ
ncbi:MAG: hypothetical protein KME30_29215 [Iphinoe sp. HA4291-MV1]|jgi:hypothetical protein|nr:hypothetical protein [Iphinoe sp. HA4291-MV1]